MTLMPQGPHPISNPRVWSFAKDDAHWSLFTSPMSLDHQWNDDERWEELSGKGQVECRQINIRKDKSESEISKSMGISGRKGTAINREYDFYLSKNHQWTRCFPPPLLDFLLRQRVCKSPSGKLKIPFINIPPFLCCHSTHSEDPATWKDGICCPCHGIHSETVTAPQGPNEVPLSFLQITLLSLSHLHLHCRDLGWPNSPHFRSKTWPWSNPVQSPFAPTPNLSPQSLAV